MQCTRKPGKTGRIGDRDRVLHSKKLPLRPADKTDSRCISDPSSPQSPETYEITWTEVTRDLVGQSSRVIVQGFVSVTTQEVTDAKQAMKTR